MDGYQAPPELSRAPMGLGCAMVAPVALFGTFMIVGHPGPPGRFGFAEYFGWWAVCVATAFCCAHFLLRFKRGEKLRFLFLFLALATPLLLGLLLWIDIQPSTPPRVKEIVEYSLQAIGIPAIVAIVAFIVWAVRNSRR